MVKSSLAHYIGCSLRVGTESFSFIPSEGQTHSILSFNKHLHKLSEKAGTEPGPRRPGGKRHSPSDAALIQTGESDTYICDNKAWWIQWRCTQNIGKMVTERGAVRSGWPWHLNWAFKNDQQGRKEMTEMKLKPTIFTTHQTTMVATRELEG